MPTENELDIKEDPPKKEKRPVYRLFPIKGEDGIVRLGMEEIKNEERKGSGELSGDNTVPQDPKV